MFVSPLKMQIIKIDIRISHIKNEKQLLHSHQFLFPGNYRLQINRNTIRSNRVFSKKARKNFISRKTRARSANRGTV